MVWGVRLIEDRMAIKFFINSCLFELVEMGVVVL